MHETQMTCMIGEKSLLLVTKAPLKRVKFHRRLKQKTNSLYQLMSILSNMLSLFLYLQIKIHKWNGDYECGAISTMHVLLLLFNVCYSFNTFIRIANLCTFFFLCLIRCLVNFVLFKIYQISHVHCVLFDIPYIDPFALCTVHWHSKCRLNLIYPQ